MSEEQDFLLPEDIKAFIEDMDLPYTPPIPISILGLLQYTHQSFLASDDRSELEEIRRLANFDSLPFSAEHTRTTAPDLPTAILYTGIGLSGYGLQNNLFLYMVETHHLRLGLSLPWGHIYNDPDRERKNLEFALQIVHACQLNLPQEGLLQIFIHKSGCRWNYTHNEDKQSGNDIASLLNFLTFLDCSANTANNLPPYLWLQV